MPIRILAQFRWLDTGTAIELVVLLLTASGAYWLLRNRVTTVETSVADLKTSVEKDLNGVGERAKELELGGENRTTRITALEKRMDNHATEMRHMSEEVGELRNAVTRFADAQHEMKLEIIGFISERTSKIDTSVHELDKTVAVMGEQVKALKESR